jgi:hypothetical protein
MEVIILGNPFLEDSGTVTPIVIPAYKAEEAVIELTNGSNPFVIGDNTGGTNINVSRDTDIIRLFVISNLTTNVLSLGISEAVIIHSINVNGIEFYDTIDYNVLGSVITFIDFLPYDSTVGNTNVRVVYSLQVNDTVGAALTASMVPLDTTNFHQNLDNTTTDVQKLADAVDVLAGGGGDPNDTKRLHNILTTGLLSGGNLSINAGDHTKFDISAFEGIVVDNTIPTAPVVTRITKSSQIGLLDIHIATGTTTYVMYNSLGNLVLTNTYPDEDARRVYIVIGWLDHPNNISITHAQTEPYSVREIMGQMNDFFENFGAFNVVGNEYYPNGNLTINRTAGTTFDNNSNYYIDPVDPHTLNTSLENPVSFTYYYQSSPDNWINNNTSTTQIDPNFYDSGSGLVGVTASYWTIQVLAWYPLSLANDIQYGQKQYATYASASADLRARIKINPYNQYDILRGWIIVKQGATNLSDTNQAVFVTADSGLRIMDLQNGGGGSLQINNHNDLDNIQGGNANERYHLVVADYNNITAGSFQYTSAMSNYANTSHTHSQYLNTSISSNFRFTSADSQLQFTSASSNFLGSAATQSFRYTSQNSQLQFTSANSNLLGSGATQSFRYTSADTQLQFTSANSNLQTGWSLVGAQTAGTTTSNGSDRLYLSAGNMMTLSGNSNTIVFSVNTGSLLGTGATASFRFTSADTNLQFTSATSNITSNAFPSANTTKFAGTGTSATNCAITLNSNGIAVSVSPSGGGDGVNIIAAVGSTAATTGTIVFSSSNGISFGLNGATMTASHNGYTGTTTGWLTTAMASNAGSNFVSTSQSSLFQFTSATSAITASAMNTNERNNYQFTSNSSVNTSVYLAIGNSTAYQTSNLSNTFFQTANSSLLQATSATSNITSNAYATANQSLLQFTSATSNITSNAFPSANTTKFAGTGTSATNATITLNSNGLAISVAAPGAAVEANNMNLSGNVLGNTTASGSTINWVGGNNITLSGLNNSQIRIDAAAGGGGVAIAGSAASTVTSGTLQFSNANGISFGLNGSTMTASVTAGTNDVTQWSLVGNNTAGTTTQAISNMIMYLSGGNNVTLSGNASTIVFSVPTPSAQITQSLWEPLPVLNTGTIQSNGTLFVYPVSVDQYVSASRAEFVASVQQSVNATLSQSANLSLGVLIYTLSNDSIRLATVSSATTQHVNGSIGSGSSSNSVSFTGQIAYSVPINVNISPGLYWIGLWSRSTVTSASATNNNQDMTQYGVAWRSTNWSARQPGISNNSAASSILQMPQGFVTVSRSQTDLSSPIFIANSTSAGGTTRGQLGQASRMPYIIFQNFTFNNITT